MNPEAPAFAGLSPAAPQRNPIWGWRDVGLFFGLGLPLIFVSQMVLGWVAGAFHYPPGNPAVQLTGQGIAYIVLFLVLALILRVQYDVPFWPTLGWVPGRVAPAASITAGFVLAFAIAVIGGLLRIPNVESPITKLIEAPHGVLFLGVFGVVIGPVAEELAFRGFLQPLLVRSLGAFAGIGITAGLFGMLHWEQNGRSWTYVVLITIAGAAFGTLRQVSGSIRASTFAHCAYNSFFLLSLLASGRKYSI